MQTNLVIQSAHNVYASIPLYINTIMQMSFAEHCAASNRIAPAWRPVIRLFVDASCLVSEGYKSTLMSLTTG